MWETFFLWAFGKHLRKVCKITESTKSGNIICGVYADHWLVGNLEVLNICSAEGACCHAGMLFST